MNKLESLFVGIPPEFQYMKTTMQRLWQRAKHCRHLVDIWTLNVNETLVSRSTSDLKMYYFPVRTWWLRAPVGSRLDSTYSPLGLKIIDGVA